MPNPDTTGAGPFHLQTMGNVVSDPSRIVNYNGYEIRIFVLPPISIENTFRAKYEVRSMTDEAQQSPRAGVIAGGLETPAQAEEAALKAAKYMID